MTTLPPSRSAATSVPRAALLCALVLLAPAPVRASAARASQEARELEPGKTVGRGIAGGETHTYRVTLAEKQFLRAVATSHGVDVLVTLHSPDGAKILEASFFNRPGPEPISFVAEKAGAYLLEVRARGTAAVKGRYELASEVRAAAGAADIERARAERLLAEAAGLDDAGTKEARLRAAAKFEESLAAWRGLGDDYWQAYALNLGGNIQSGLGEHRKALGYFELALALRRAIGDKIGEASTTYNVGLMHYRLDDGRKALEYLAPALAAYRALGNRNGEAGALQVIGHVYRQLGDHRQSLEHYELSLPIRREVDGRAGEADARLDIGNAYHSLGEQQKSLDHYGLALAAYSALGSKRGEARALDNIGRSYRALGEKRKALDYYGRVLPIYRDLKDRGEEAILLRIMGDLHFSSGEMQKALDAYLSALPIVRETGDRLREANTLSDIALTYGNMGRASESLAFYEQAVAVYRALGERADEARVLFNMALAHESSGDWRKALDHYEQALPIRRALGDRKIEADILHNMGFAYGKLSDQEKELELYLRALTLYQEAGYDGADVADTINNIGNTYRQMGKTQQALEFHNRALAFARGKKARDKEAHVLFSLNSLYYLQEEHRKAIEYAEQALPIYKELGDRTGQINMLKNLGNSYGDLSDLQKALDNGLAALALAREMKDRGQEAELLNNIGNIYTKLNEYAKASDALSQALPIWRQLNAPVGEHHTLIAIGYRALYTGDKPKAREAFEAALALARSYGGVSDEGTALFSLGRFHQESGDQQKALEYFTAALSLAKRIGDRSGAAFAHNASGVIYKQLGKYQEALGHYQQALALKVALGDSGGEASVLNNLAYLESDRGNLPAAREHVERAIRIVESNRARYTNEELRTSYFATVQKYYEFYVDLLMRLHKQRPAEGFDGLALQASERARARALLDLLAESGADIRQGADPELLKRERDLRDQINAAALRQAKLLGSEHTPQQAEAAAGEIRTLTTDLQQVEAQIRRTSPRYAALTQPTPLSLKEIQTQVLDADTLLLEYSLGEERSYLWAVINDSVRSYELPKRAEIEEAARQFYALLTAQPRGAPVAAPSQGGLGAALRQQSEERAAELSAKVGRVLLGPAAHQLDRKRLLVVADGALQYVPFAALVVPPAGEAGAAAVAQPLVVSHEIVNLPSASTVAVLRREVRERRPATKTLAVLADPVFESTDERLVNNNLQQPSAGGNGAARAAGLGSLVPDPAAVRAAAQSGVARGGAAIPRLPGTRREAEQIAALVPAALRKQALDFDANRAAVTGPDLGDFRFVHFATHGLLNSQHPELSGLMLSMFDETGRARDGFLRSHEVFNLRLNADVVVLSACQTGLGKEVRGEGLVGLTRGFMYAGSPRVVVSLWSVSDEATAALMSRFYRGALSDGLRPAEALRAAQVSLLRDKKYAYPFYWAAFTLQGEWR